MGFLERDSFEWDSFSWAGTLAERLPSKQFDEHRLGVVMGIEVVLSIGVALGIKIAQWFSRLGCRSYRNRFIDHPCCGHERFARNLSRHRCLITTFGRTNIASTGCPLRHAPKRGQQRWSADRWRTFFAIVITAKTEWCTDSRQRFSAVVVTAKAKRNLNARQALGLIVIAAPLADAIRNRTAEKSPAWFSCLCIGR